MKKGILLKLLIILIGLNILAFPVEADLPSIDSEEAIYLIDDSTGTVIYEQNEDVKYAPASITKLLTALIMVENIDDLNQTVTVGNEVNDFTIEDSRAMLWEGQQLSYNDLLYAMLVPSGNDAAQTIAINVGKVLANTEDRAIAEAAFYGTMNEKAQELGMVSSHFSNPHGRSASDHYTTAKDYTLLTKAALSNEIIKNASSTKRYTLKNQDGTDNIIYSSDYCLYTDSNDMNGYPGISLLFPNLTGNQPNQYYSPFISGAKTGRADNGARSYAFYSDQNDNQIFGVILNSMDSLRIFSEARDLTATLDSDYSDEDVESILEQNGSIEVENISIISPKEFNITTADSEIFDDKNAAQENNIEYRFDNDLITANEDGYTLINSIEEGQKVGSVLVSNSNGITQTIPIYAEHNYYSKNFLDLLYENSIYIIIGLVIILGIIVLIIHFKKVKSKVKF